MSAPLVLADARQVGVLAAELVANRIRARSRLRLLLPAGDAPPSLSAALRAHVADGSLPTSHVSLLAPHQAVSDPAGLDLAVVGLELGADGVPCEAPAVGLGPLLAAREVLLLVTGRENAEALRATLEDPAAPDVPATRIRDHPRMTVLCDRAAAGALAPRANRDSDHVAIVLGHREPGISAEHRISAHSRARLRRAVRLADREALRSVVLTGFTHSGGLSEAEQMALEWSVADVPVLLEVAGRNTAENASRSLPLVLAQDGVRRVTVVTSVWHLRTPYYFAPYRAHGLEVRFRWARPLRGWAHLLAEELGALAAMRAQRAAAMGAVRLPDGARLGPESS